MNRPLKWLVSGIGLLSAAVLYAQTTTIRPGLPQVGTPNTPGRVPGVVAPVPTNAGSETLRPGPLSDGSSLLTTGWRVQPAGKQIPVGALPMSTALSPDGRFLVVLNAGRAGVGPASLSVMRAESLEEISRVRAPDTATGPFTAWKGLRFSTNGRNLYVGGGTSNSVYEFTLSDAGQLGFRKQMRAAPEVPGANDFIGDVAIPPAGRLVYAADLFHDRIIVFNPQSGVVIERFRSGRRPYQILFHPDGKSYFVSSWADGAIYQYDTDSGQELNRIRLAPHPMGMVLSDRKLEDDTSDTRYRLFVAIGNTNNVITITINGNKEMKQVDVLNVGFSANLPAGMTPTALALSPDQTKLLIACSGVNAVAVADITESRAQLSGFVGVGSYPTSLRVLANAQVLVTNAFGTDGATGSLSLVDNILAEKDTAHLSQLTDDALALVPPIPETDPAVPATLDHVVYISIDPSAGAKPVAAKLAREFVAVRNYAPNSTAALDRVYWAFSGFPPPLTRLAPDPWTRGRLEGGEPANQPSAGYLWTSVLSSGKTVRNYGFFVEPTPTALRVKEPSLQAATNLNFPVPATATIVDGPAADTARAQAMFDDLDQWKQRNAMPNLVMARLPASPNADALLGAIVEQLSSSPFWSRTAVFVEGASPEAPLLIVSPYSRTIQVDGAYANTSSVLRTMEALLKLHPLTLTDATARPLSDAFGATADPAKFTVK